MRKDKVGRSCYLPKPLNHPQIVVHGLALH